MTQKGVENSPVAPKKLVRVVLWMTGALVSFSAMAVSVRDLGTTLGVMEILALRAPLGLLVMATLAGLRAELRATINCRHIRLHLFRNTVHVGSSYLWAMSLLLIPLAMTFALEFSTPAWTLLLASPILGERLTASRIGAVVLGLLGVLVILRPGLATFQPGALLALTAAFGLAVTLIATKKLTRTDSTFAILFWMMLIQLPIALLFSEPLFVTKLTQAQAPAVIGIGVAGLARRLRVSRRGPDRHRHPLEPAQRGRASDEAVALALCADEIDLDQRIRHQQARAADRGARRRLLEVAFPHRVEAMEVLEVGEKHLRLDHLIERGARRLEGLFQIVEDVCGLQFNIRAVERKALLLSRLRRHAGAIIARDLTGGENMAAEGEALAVVRERPRRCRFDDLVLATGA